MIQINLKSGLKAIILYRISTDKQDKSLQEDVCRRFCENHKMQIVDEYSEIDVSGFKTPIEKRYTLLEILNRAEEKKDFDVLVVYLHDRLGRREDETPKVIQDFYKNGVRCFSAHNNEEIKVKSHTDKLMNYMNSWTSELESIKTSARVKDAMRTKYANSLQYMGGTPPFGYKIKQTNRINDKGKVISILVIDDKEARIVKKIFELATIYNYGGTRIAKYLNEGDFQNRKKISIDKVTGKRIYEKCIFRANSINRILKNTVYIGKKIYNRTTSKRDTIIRNKRKDWKTRAYNPELQIIDKEVFEEAQLLLEKRKTVKNSHVTTSTKSHNLCSGMAYCICGSKLKSDYSIKKYTKKNGDVTITKTYRYTCIDGINSRKTHRKKYGTSVVFSAKKYDGLVLESLAEEISLLGNYDSSEHLLQLKNREIEEVNSDIEYKSNEIKKISQAIIKYENMIDSTFKNGSDEIDIFINGIKRNKQKVEEIELEINKFYDKIKKLEEEKSKINTRKEKIISFEKKFKEADLDSQKAILSKLVNKIIFDEEKIRIDVNI